MINLWCGRPQNTKRALLGENFIEKAFEVIKDWKVSCFDGFFGALRTIRALSLLFM
jgi:hypothetical protein